MKHMTQEEIKAFAQAITGVVTGKSKGKPEKLKKLTVKVRPLNAQELAENKHQEHLARRREQVRKRKERKALEAQQVTQQTNEAVND